ncbi:hypothetical protein H072_6105 [Dactylellina haptotyla CBS 200.50]|uniref:Uncharacterized protein n=1 Tax=Dactylellina haptotyla (strain CBS 200.50) TaxID=1284197 RepID=S8BL08_DACHA|nr:hypothetical protein H072_6105 [Dactylellina haptotyla CBS 200.50]
MSSPRSTSSLQSLAYQALGVSGSSTISGNGSKSKTHDARENSYHLPKTLADSSIASLSTTRSGSSRKSRHPVGNVAEAASPETFAPSTPQCLNINTSSCPTCNQPSLLYNQRENSRADVLLFAHTAFSMADAPVPDGCEPVVSLPIALFIPPRHIPELWKFPTPQPSDHASNLRDADPGNGAWYQYTLQNYLAESYSEDPYPLRCRLHFRQP